MSDAKDVAAALLKYATEAEPGESFGAWLARNCGPIDWSKVPRLSGRGFGGTFHERKAERIAARKKSK